MKNQHTMHISPFTFLFIWLSAMTIISCGTDSGPFKGLPFEGGNGTSENPFQVASVEQLQVIGDSLYLDKHFIQVTDIDASKSAEFQNGSGFQPIGTREKPFTGSFNGNGYTISALFIHNQRSSDNATGFFGYVKNGMIEDVTIDNQSPDWNKHIKASEQFKNRQKGYSEVRMSELDLSNARGIGGLVGYNDAGTVRNSVYKGGVSGHIHQGIGGFAGINTGLIENCHFVGNISSGSTAGFAWTNGGQIRNSSTEGSADGMTSHGFVSTNYGEIVNSYADMDISGSNGAAAFARSNIGGVIESSFATGSTFSGYNIAGFVRNNSGEIRNVYSTTELEVVDYYDDRQIAGIVVSNEDKGIIENSYFAGTVEITGSSGFTKAAIIENLGTVGSLYWDMERSGLNDAVENGPDEGATGLTTAQMTGPSTDQNMPGFDWVNIWRINEDGYPVLRWEGE